jgi:hypothetical protein
MIDDVVERKLFIGMLRAEVEELLGPPTYPVWNEKFPYPGWALGPAPGKSSSAGLCIRFRSGRVAEVFIPHRVDDPVEIGGSR